MILSLSLAAHAATITFYTTAASHPDTRDLLSSEGALNGGEYGGLEGGTPNPLIDGPAFAPFVILGAAAQDPATLGDRLATLVDQGGTVVEVPFTLGGQVALGGRWASQGYGAFTVTGGATGVERQLTAPPPGSPLFARVEGLTNGADGWHGTGITLSPGAVVHGTWDDGSPVLAVRQVGPGQVITLNFWPGSEIASPGWLRVDEDAPDLIANLAWFVGGSDPSTMDVDQYGPLGSPLSFVVDAGGTPLGGWALIHGPDTGAAPIPAGVCAGVSTGLQSPQLARTGSFDAAGRATVQANPGLHLRYRRFAFVDMTTCEVSEPHWVR